MVKSQPALSKVAEEIAYQKKFRDILFTAEGAFKETFKAETEGGGTVALKVLDPAKCTPSRMEREIDAMIRCNLPYIAKLYEHGEFSASDGIKYLYVVEDFLDGGTLASRTSGKLEPDVVRHYGVCLSKALEHLASLDLVHRDIKPDNIMFKSNADDPILVDFGLVRNLSASSLTQTWLAQGPGTPYFSAPEQLNNEKDLIKWRTDQFSLGIVLGICLTGKHPFTYSRSLVPDTVNDMAQKKKCTSEFRNEVSAMGFGNIIKMIEPWPINRFATPTALLQSF